MFLHVSAILFTEGVCPIACWDTTQDQRQAPPPQSRHPSGTRHPPEQTPRNQAPLPGADTTLPGSRPSLDQGPPQSRHPPDQAHTPWEQTPPPPGQCMLGDTGNKRSVRILLECNLIYHPTLYKCDVMLLRVIFLMYYA